MRAYEAMAKSRNGQITQKEDGRGSYAKLSTVAGVSGVLCRASASSVSLHPVSFKEMNEDNWLPYDSAYANKIRDEWVGRLEKAKGMDEVKTIVRDIQNFTFVESMELSEI